MRGWLVLTLFLTICLSVFADGSIKTLRYPVARGARTDPIDIYSSKAVFISTFDEPMAVCAVDTSTNGNYLKAYTYCALSNDYDAVHADVGSGFMSQQTGGGWYNCKQGSYFNAPNLTNRLAMATNWTMLGRIKVPTDDNLSHQIMSIQAWYFDAAWYIVGGVSWFGAGSCVFVQHYTNNVKCLEVDSANVLQSLTNTWLHLAFTYDHNAQQYRAFTNGYECALSVTTGVPVANAFDLTFAENPQRYWGLSTTYLTPNNGQFAWSGGKAYYDDYAFYSRELTDNEVLACYQNSTNYPTDPTNLIYRYQFTNYPYIAVVDDKSGKNNDATLRASMPKWDKGTYAFEYEDGMDFPDLEDFEFNTNGGCTIIYDYMNAGVIGGQGCDIMKKNNGDKAEWYLDSWGGVGGRNFRFGIYDTTGAGGAIHANVGAYIMNAGEPHQCAVVWTGGTQGTNVILYVDGVQKGTGTKSGNFVNSGGSTSTVQFGGRPSPNGAGYKISSMRVYKGVAFKSNEVALVYQLYPPQF